jgi:predicted metal-dependent HD superfamily phosphohydrolase
MQKTTTESNLSVIISLYGSPGRYYHTMTHVWTCLNQLKLISELSDKDSEILKQALFWHDAIYEWNKSDNEERSAQLAYEHCSESIRDEVKRLILLTKSHATEEADLRGSVMISIDLSILGATPSDYKIYADQIRREYSIIPKFIYRKRRISVLEHFLKRSPIFPYQPYRIRYEHRARENIRNEIDRLSKK